MGAISDAFTALKNVLLMQERIDGLKGDNARMTDDQRALAEKVFDLNTRVVRIETALAIWEKSGPPPQIEGH